MATGGAACGRQGGGRGRDPRPRHPARHHHRRPSGEDYARAGTPVYRRHRRTRACREQRPEAEPADGRQPAQDHRRGDGRGLRRLRRCDIDGPVDRERRTTSCSRSSSAAPRNARSARPGPRAGSPTTSRAVRHPSPRHQPAGRPDAVPAPSRSCRRSPASSSPRQPASAMLSRCARVMGGGRRGAPPATPSPACRRDRISDQQ